MTDQDMIVAAAERVLGYERIPDWPTGKRLPSHYAWALKNTPLPFCLWDGSRGDDSQGLLVFREYNRGVVWNPLESLADAMELIASRTDWTIEKSGNRYTVDLVPWVASDVLLPRAITLATLRAVGVQA